MYLLFTFITAFITHSILLVVQFLGWEDPLEKEMATHSSILAWEILWTEPKNTGVGSLSLLQGIFPTQGSNQGLLHCRPILYQQSHQGSPVKHLI